MLILFGTRKVKIRTFTDEAAPCGNCGEYRKHYRIYQLCFHIFWIPVFPIGSKYMISDCTRCKAKYEVFHHPELSAMRTPLYMFSILLIIPIILIFGFISSKQSEKQTAEYIQNPIPGDIYLMRDTTNNKSLYYFSKILEVESDSVYIQIGAYSYNRYTSRMDKDDYYVTDYFYGFHKDALKEWHSGGLVKKIKRSKKP